MNSNQQLLNDFYTAFQNKDYKTMQSCYHNDAIFSDEVFIDLNAEQVKSMWEMLITGGTDLRLEFKNVSANDKNGIAEWTAYYTFSRSGNKVVNRIKAEFLFKDGKILDHKDHFNFYTWARQALGFPGLMLGWTSFMKNKIRATAKKNLESFMRKKNS